MNIPSTVHTFLAIHKVSCKGRQITPAQDFDTTLTEAGIARSRVIKPVLLKSGSAYLMAVVRADQEPDLPLLGQLFKRDFTHCNEREVKALFPNCDQRLLPPLAEPYGLRSIVDKDIAGMDKLYFATGAPGLLLSTSGAEFVGKLHQGGWRGRTIVQRCKARPVITGGEAMMRERLKSGLALPAMPELAAEIIRFRNNPYAHAGELAAVIEQDPGLSAQVMRYAGSPLYHGHGRIHTVEQAIVQVLGMDLAEDLAFGLSLGRAFDSPREGPLGLDSVWQHALYCASLTLALCRQMDAGRAPPASMAYLSGLLHNFGLLLLGHLFPAQFARINQALTAEPHCNVLELERATIAVSHTELGLWLMEAWEMPREIVEAVSEHHNAEHRGDHAVLANLIYIANALLKRHGIGDAEETRIPEALLRRFGLDEGKLALALGSVMQGREGLELMAAKMAA